MDIRNKNSQKSLFRFRLLGEKEFCKGLRPSETKIQVSDGLFISIKMRQVLKTCRGMGTYSSDGKPGSVADSHSSRHIIAGVLKQPTRTLGEQRHRVLFGLAPNGV